jgi:hypothetical protein
MWRGNATKKRGRAGSPVLAYRDEQCPPQTSPMRGFLIWAEAPQLRHAFGDFQATAMPRGTNNHGGISGILNRQLGKS